MASCHTADSKTVKQEVNGTMILTPLVFPDSSQLTIQWNITYYSLEDMIDGATGPNDMKYLRP
jgi:hypothetical protein